MGMNGTAGASSRLCFRILFKRTQVNQNSLQRSGNSSLGPEQSSIVTAHTAGQPSFGG